MSHLVMRHNQDHEMIQVIAGVGQAKEMVFGKVGNW